MKSGTIRDAPTQGQKVSTLPVSPSWRGNVVEPRLLVRFKLPEVPEGRLWVRLLDTNDPKLPRAEYALGAEYLVTGRSLLLFLLQRDDAEAQPHPDRKPEKRKVPEKK